MNEQRLKSYMQERLGSYEHPVDGTLWASLEGSLPAKKRRRPMPLILSVAAAAAVAALALLLFAPSADDIPVPVTVTEDLRPETSGEIPSPAAEKPQRDIVTNPRIAQQAVEPVKQIISDMEKTETGTPVSDEGPGPAPAQELPSGEPSRTLEETTPAAKPEKERRPVNGYPPYPYQMPVRRGKDLSVMLAVNGSTAGTIEQIPVTDTSNPEEIFRKMDNTVHDFPISFTLAVRKGLSGKFAIESGLTYTYLHSKDNSAKAEFSMHYLGIPLKGIYTYYDTGRFSLYASAGGMVEKQVAGRVKDADSRYWYVHSTLQLSVNAAAGAQFRVGDQFSLFAEPGVSYFFDNGGLAKTIRKDRPLNFNFQLGVRFNIN